MTGGDPCLLPEFPGEVTRVMETGLVGDFGGGEARIGQEPLGPFEALRIQICQRAEAKILVKEPTDMGITASQGSEQGLNAALSLPAEIEQLLGRIRKLWSGVCGALFARFWAQQLH